MKKKIILFAALLVAIIPAIVYAENELEEDFDFDNEFNAELLSQDTKYYKTVTQTNLLPMRFENSPNSTTASIPTSYTVEITEEEYNNAGEGESTNGDSSIETAYKKMTTSVYSWLDRYRYKNIVHWKVLPSVRSYDIIGIGMYSNLKIGAGPVFGQKTCTSSSDSSCSTNYTHISQTFKNGAGATFKMATGSPYSLDEIFYYDVVKNTTATIYQLDAIGDYSHATTNVTSSQAQDYIMRVGGIQLGSSINSYYDAISSTDAWLSVNW